MRKLLCKLFNKHDYKKTGANQHGYFSCCKYCGKKQYIKHSQADIILKLLEKARKKAGVVRPIFADKVPLIKPIENYKGIYNYRFKTIKKLPKNFGKIK